MSTDILLWQFDLDHDELKGLSDYFETVTYSVGEQILSEGGEDRDFYIVEQGHAHIFRGDLIVDRVKKSDYFGELALIAGCPRTASVVAVSTMSVSVLSLENYIKLSGEQPDLALRFVQMMVVGLGRRLTKMTENVSGLLAARSFPRRSSVKVVYEGKEKSVRTGVRYSSLLPSEVNKHPVVGALVNHRPVTLMSGVSSDCELKPLTTEHWEGLRIYRRSLALLFFEAVHRLNPALVVTCENTMDLAWCISIDEDGFPSTLTAHEIEKEMNDLVLADHPLWEYYWTAEEAHHYFSQFHFFGAAQLTNLRSSSTIPVVSYGHMHVLGDEVYAHRTGLLYGFRVYVEEDQYLLMHEIPGDIQSEHLSWTNVPSEGEKGAVGNWISKALKGAGSSLQEHKLWLERIGVFHAGDFNQACVTGKVSRLIRVAEGFQEKRIGQIADQITSNVSVDGLRVICIGGPSSSGKTTFMKRLRVQLQVNGINTTHISLDDYYVNRVDMPIDENGEYDFESFDALQTDLFREHTRRLFSGECVKTAHFDFLHGLSSPEGGREISLGKKDLLILEGIHGLNPQLLSDTQKKHVFRVFLCPLYEIPLDRLTRVHSSDLRLLRRLIRDRHFRGTSVADNINRWPSVRRGERRHIFPYQNEADVVFDTSLIYELSVLKVYAERYLLEVPQADPAYTTAYRLLRLLENFVSIYPDHVPPTSILREFIGGSGFEY